MELEQGRLVSLGGREVRLSHLAGTSPAVLLLGGCGVPSTLWRPVISRLNEDGVAVLTLDRPGMAGSRWPGRLPTLAEELDTLGALTDQLSELFPDLSPGRAAGPMIVVGHSMAGPHAEAFARRRPEAVAGLVLIDSSVEWNPRPGRFEQGWLRLARLSRTSMRARPARSLAVLADRAMVSAQSKHVRLAKLPAWADSAYRSPDAVAMVIAEQAAYGRQLSDLGDLRADEPWPGTSTVLLTATGDGGQDWERQQARYARLLGGDQMVLPDSNHLIMLDRPDAVRQAIHQLR